VKRICYTLSVIAISCASASVVHAQDKCKPQRQAFDKAASDYTRTESLYTRLQQTVDSKSEQAEFRRAILEGNVAQAEGQLQAAKAGAIGQGLGCLFAPRPSCIGPTANRVAQQIARASANVKAQQGRLDAFNKATATQMTRLSQSVTRQETVVKAKKSVLDQREAAYNACLGK
jgi:hypothetical protein